MPDPIHTQQPVTHSGGLLRIRLDLAYDGSGFAGWARQPGQRTVAGEVVSALSRVLRIDTPRLVVAGRTDAGVHALGQVCHVDLDPDCWLGAAAGVRRLNAVLPADVRIRSAQAAPPGFDARFSALYRRYEYLLSDSGLLDPRARHAVVTQRRTLDAQAMHAAALRLLGEHDFAAFCKPRPGASTVRTVNSVSVSRRPDPRDPELVVVDIAADAFCHSMVRAIVGALVVVGQGRLSADELADILTARSRSARFATAPAHGLALVEVAYPTAALLADQASRARRFRG